MKSTKNKNFNFKIGADPEFNIFLHDTRLSAARLLETLFDNNQPRYQKADKGFTVKGGNIGWDCSDSTGEIRPNPNYNPIQVADNIKKILKEFANKAEIFELTSLSMGAPIGGHIHLEVPSDITNEKLNKINKILTAFYWPILMGENKVNIYNRIKEGYGEIENMRSQEQESGARTFEFRAPSAEWTTTQKLAEATLAYMGVIFHEININQDKLLKLDKIIYKNKRQANALQELAISEFGGLTKILTKEIYKVIKTFERYKDFKQEIDYIFKPYQILKDKDKVQYDILRGWGIVKRTMPTKKSILTIKKTTKNIDPYYKLIHIPFNEDHKVSLFVETLKEKILTQDWRLQNNYFIFGLKKGIKEYMAINCANEFLNGGNQIKTTGDLERVNKTFQKLKEKFYINIPDKRLTHKETSKEAQKNIIIGIPYETRQRENKKGFLALIYDIEKNKLKPVAIKEKNLTENKEKGIIANLYNRNKDLKIGKKEKMDAIKNTEEIHDTYQPVDQMTTGHINTIPRGEF